MNENDFEDDSIIIRPPGHPNEAEEILIESLTIDTAAEEGVEDRKIQCCSVSYQTDIDDIYGAGVLNRCQNYLEASIHRRRNHHIGMLVGVCQVHPEALLEHRYEGRVTMVAAEELLICTPCLDKNQNRVHPNINKNKLEMGIIKKVRCFCCNGSKVFSVRGNCHRLALKDPLILRSPCDIFARKWAMGEMCGCAAYSPFILPEGFISSSRLDEVEQFICIECVARLGAHPHIPLGREYKASKNHIGWCFYEPPLKEASKYEGDLHYSPQYVAMSLRICGEAMVALGDILVYDQSKMPQLEIAKLLANSDESGLLEEKEGNIKALEVLNRFGEDLRAVAGLNHRPALQRATLSQIPIAKIVSILVDREVPGEENSYFFWEGSSREGHLRKVQAAVSPFMLAVAVQGALREGKGVIGGWGLSKRMNESMVLPNRDWRGIGRELRSIVQAHGKTKSFLEFWSKPSKLDESLANTPKPLLELLKGLLYSSYSERNALNDSLRRTALKANKGEDTINERIAFAEHRREENINFKILEIISIIIHLVTGIVPWLLEFVALLVSNYNLINVLQEVAYLLGFSPRHHKTQNKIKERKAKVADPAKAARRYLEQEDGVMIAATDNIDLDFSRFSRENIYDQTKRSYHKAIRMFFIWRKTPIQSISSNSLQIPSVPSETELNYGSNIATPQEKLNCAKQLFGFKESIFKSINCFRKVLIDNEAISKCYTLF